MLSILQFIFSSFWVWAGMIIMIISTGTAIAEVILAVKAEK